MRDDTPCFAVFCFAKGHGSAGNNVVSKSACTSMLMFLIALHVVVEWARFCHNFFVVHRAALFPERNEEGAKEYEKGPRKRARVARIKRVKLVCSFVHSVGCEGDGRMKTTIQDCTTLVERKSVNAVSGDFSRFKQWVFTMV